MIFIRTILFSLLIYANTSFADEYIFIEEGSSGLAYKRGENAPFTGIWKLYHPESGLLRWEQEISHGLIKSEKKYFLSNGKIEVAIFYEGDGVIYRNSFNKLNKDFRAYQVWYYENGNVRSEGNISHFLDDHGKRIGGMGLHKLYYEYGRLEKEINYVGNMQFIKNFRDDGSLESEWSLMKPYIRHGAFKTYDLNGRLISTKFFNFDKEVFK